MTTLVATIFVLGILIFFHELGHFLVAKKSGIRVEKFSLGFPPKAIGKKIGETEYCISWIPLGGYVKMAGEEPEETKIEGKPWEFMSKPVGIRALVIAAGPVMNFILAILIFWGIIFTQGIDSTRVGLVEPGGPADKAGMITGDLITSVDGTEVTFFRDLTYVIHQQVEKPIQIKWNRDGEEFTSVVTTQKDSVMDATGQTQVVGRIGIGSSDDRIKVGIFKSFWEATNSVIFILVVTIKILWGLITGAVSIELLGGPVFIAQTAGQTAKLGFVYLLSFTALLSVNLSLLNVLPVPPLDGGHLLFLSIEKIKGSQLSIKNRAAMQMIGLALLILLIIRITYNDVLRLMQ